MEVSNKIRDVRKFKGFTQSDVATLLGISQRAYSKIELNETELNWKKLNQIASILDIGVWELVDTEKVYDPQAKIAQENLDMLQQLIHQYEDRIDTLEYEVAELKSKVEETPA